MAASVEGAFPWRLIAVARYALVSVVSIFAVAVIVKALSSLRLKGNIPHLVVLGGSVMVDRFQKYPPAVVVFRFTLRATNPTVHHVYYDNIMSSLVDESDKDSVYAFNVMATGKNIALLPEITLDSNAVLENKGISTYPPFQNLMARLYDENSITMALQLNGTLKFYNSSRDDIAFSDPIPFTTRTAIYYCWPMTASFNPGSSNDVSCVPA